MKHLIMEIDPESAEMQFYFDGDTFTEKAGDFCYTLFIIQTAGYGRLSGQMKITIGSYAIMPVSIRRIQRWK